MTKEEQEAFLLNNLKKLVYIDNKLLNDIQKDEVKIAKSKINNLLDGLRNGKTELNENDYIEIKNIIKKYSRYIMKECYL